MTYLDHVRLRGPDVLAALGFEWGTAWKRRRLRTTLALGLLPLLAVLLIALLKIPGIVPALAVDILPFIFVIGYMQILLVVLPLVQGTNLVAREAEAKTLTFLLTRPLSRASLLLGKFLGSWAVLCVLLCSSWLLATVLLMSVDGFLDASRAFRAMPGNFLVLCMGALVYGSLFTLIGLIGKRPALVGLFMAFGWENIIVFLPGTIRNLTVRHHLVGLLPDGGIPDGVQITLSAPPVWQALTWLFAGAALAMALSLVIFSSRDYP